MQKEGIVNFIVEIIKNGSEKHLSIEDIKVGIQKYRTYLKTQELMNAEVDEIFNVIDRNITKLVNLYPSYGEDRIADLILGNKENKKRNK